MKKEEIQEIIDSNNNMIGSETKPETGADKETEANKTTDYNARVHGQNFKNDFLGRFGFYFYESQNHGDMSPIIKEMSKVVGASKAKDVMEAIKPVVENILDEMGDPLLSEAKIVEDKIGDKKEDKSIKAKKNAKAGISDKKLDKIADLLVNLPKNELDKLINLLETKKK